MTTMSEKNSQYDNVPVHYCRNCYSLGIIILDHSSQDYCLECSSTDTGICSIE